jgi:hypothetical protein
LFVADVTTSMLVFMMIMTMMVDGVMCCQLTSQGRDESWHRHCCASSTACKFIKSDINPLCVDQAHAQLPETASCCASLHQLTWIAGERLSIKPYTVGRFVTDGVIQQDLTLATGTPRSRFLIA